MATPNSRAPIYLDHAATTALRPEAIEAWNEAARDIGNPSSLHDAGRKARERVEEAREAIAQAVGAQTPAEIVFTSGGTESNNLAVKGLFWQRHGAENQRKIIVTSPIEHHAVLDSVEWLEKAQGAQAVWVPVDQIGRVDVESLSDLLQQNEEQVALVSIMWANNETGTVQPIQQIAEAAHRLRVPVHSDAIQAFGQIPVNFAESGLDAMSVNAHKVGGPVSVGALVLARHLTLTPLLHGGGQERFVRSGTLDVPGILAFSAAVQATLAEREKTTARIAGLRNYLIAGVQERVPFATLKGDPDPGGRLPGNAFFAFEGCEGDSLLFLLDTHGIHTSTGSACTAGVAAPSHVLMAMGLTEEQARGAQRFTLGKDTTKADIDALLAVIREVADRARVAGLVASEPIGIDKKKSQGI